MSADKQQRPGSGQDAPPGEGKSGFGATQPQAGSTEKPGTPGEIRYGTGPVTINAGREVTTIRVVNTGDRPITVGSHYHFAEANPALDFDRQAAWGKHQNILAGGLTRFDPGAPQEIELVPFVGRRVAAGFRGECGGSLDG
jgi:urease beta subunit